MAARHGVAEVPLTWQARAEAAEQRLAEFAAHRQAEEQAQQAAAPFEQRYEDLSRLLPMLVAEIRSRATLGPLVQFMEELLHFYQQHPGLAAGEPRAQQRLQQVQWLRAAVVAQHAAWGAPPAAARPTPPAADSAPAATP